VSSGSRTSTWASFTVRLTKASWQRCRFADANQDRRPEHNRHTSPTTRIFLRRKDRRHAERFDGLFQFSSMLASANGRAGCVPPRCRTTRSADQNDKKREKRLTRRPAVHRRAEEAGATSLLVSDTSPPPPINAMGCICKMRRQGFQPPVVNRGSGPPRTAQRKPSLRDAPLGADPESRHRL